MSLLRLAFWLALIVLLLPTDAQQQARLSSFANNAMGRVGTFCERNGRVCAVGAEIWATFLKKAEFGIQLVGDLLGVGGGPLPHAPRAPEGRGGPADPRRTLPPPQVYYPPWRGHPRRSGD